jgi:mannonate dehydratase
MLLPPKPDRRWVVARQMGVTAAIAKLAPDLTGRPPPFDESSLRASIAEYRSGGFEIVGLEGDQFDMSRIKLGLPGRDEDLDRYCAMLQAMGACGVRLLCFNFMAGIGWYRTGGAVTGRGGALVTGFSAAAAAAEGPTDLGAVTESAIWENFRHFMSAVAHAAEKAGVTMALHPDDPPVSPLRGIGRILTSADAVERALDIAASPAVRLTFCQGSFASMGDDPVKLVARFRDRIAFIHVRDIRRTAGGFVETFPDEGDTDMTSLFAAYAEAGLDVPIRPDHAPAMDGDPRHDGPVVGTNVGYEANGMIFTVGFMKGLMQGARIAER